MKAYKLDVIEVSELLALLPHRYPFHLVDKIVNINEDLSGTGIKNVTINEPFFAGHFPGYPVMPGVLIVEAMAQTAGAICIRQYDSVKRKLVYFMSIENARFRKPVIPGDILKLYVTRIKRRHEIFRYGCEARVDGRKIAEATITATIRIDSKDN